MAWYTNGQHTNRPPAPVPLYQALRCRARTTEDYGHIMADLGAPEWYVEAIFEQAAYLWQLADSKRPPIQLKLPLSQE